MQDRPRVALIALHFAEYSANLAEALAADADVLLVLYRSNADNELGVGWEKSLNHPQLQVLVLERPHTPLAIVKNIFQLVSTLNGFAPSVIHYQEGNRDELLFSLPFFRSLPKVVTVHDPAPHSGVDAARHRYSRIRLYGFLMRRSADAAVVHGKLLATELERVCPWFAGKIAVIAHGPLGLRHASRLSQRPSGMRLLFFGRIHKYKGLGHFVAAVIRLHREGLAVVGVVAGAGSDLDEHRAAMAAAGCFEVLEGYIPSADVPKLFREARAVVLPYIDGTQSGVAAMALGFGCPVIATAVGSIPELVRNGQNGLLVAPADTAALTDAIRSVVLDDDLWDHLAQGGLDLREGELAWRSLGAQTLKVYESIRKN